MLKRAAAPPEGGGKPVKPPNRQSVMQRLKFGIMINMVGFFFTLTGEGLAPPGLAYTIEPDDIGRWQMRGGKLDQVTD